MRYLILGVLCRFWGCLLSFFLHWLSAVEKTETNGPSVEPSSDVRCGRTLRSNRPGASDRGGMFPQARQLDQLWLHQSPHVFATSAVRARSGEAPRSSRVAPRTAYSVGKGWNQIPPNHIPGLVVGVPGGSNHLRRWGRSPRNYTI